MIFDIRTYTFHPGKMPVWIEIYQQYAWPLQQKYLGDCVGFYTTFEGGLNRVVHIWRYESQADREARRAALVKDPAWSVFLEKSTQSGSLLTQENSIARAAPFFSAK